MYSFSFYFNSPFYKYKNLFNEAITKKDDFKEGLCNDIIKVNVDIHKFHDENDFNNVCQVSLSYLADLYENYHNNMDEGCKYMYYGIYGKILKNKIYDYNKLQLYKVLLKGYYDYINQWDSFESYIEEINEDILEKNTDLMEMYDNLDNFKENTNEEIKERCIYVNKCIEIYSKYAEKYKTNNDSFCVELNKFIERYNKHMETDFPCDNSQNFLPYIGRSNLKIILIPIILITLKLFILYILYKVNINYIYQYLYGNTLFYIYS
ncbi:hypothetical protein PVMG_04577 [Plasmodium vivax Mauritania I]|uniref:Variable surface protein n=1 Tax=Plasmodium vivax Mauritania I TaxID=1035515 RepID=A0A0J9T536_PLAVI|nr:hypothetical protein PVMG_04577 [Plasmodium vivax Mauritania I]